MRESREVQCSKAKEIVSGEQQYSAHTITKDGLNPSHFNDPLGAPSLCYVTVKMIPCQVPTSAHAARVLVGRAIIGVTVPSGSRRGGS